MILVNAGCAPGGVTYHGYGYTGVPDAFSWKTLFFLESSVDLIQTCTQCSPLHAARVYIACAPGGATCHMSDFMVVLNFQVILCAKFHFSNNVQDLTKIHVQCSYGDGPIQYRVYFSWRHGNGYRAARCTFMENVISPPMLNKNSHFYFYINLTL